MRRGDGAKPDNYTFAARSAPKPRKSYSNLGRKQVTAFLKQSAADMTFGLRHPIRRVTGKNQGPQNMIFPGFGGKVPTKVHVPAPKEALARTFAESKAADPRIALNRKLAGQAHRMRPTPDAAMYDWLDMGTKAEVTPRGMAVQQQLEKFQNRMRGQQHYDRHVYPDVDFRPFELDFLRRPRRAMPDHVKEANLEEGMFTAHFDQNRAAMDFQTPIRPPRPVPLQERLRSAPGDLQGEMWASPEVGMIFDELVARNGRAATPDGLGGDVHSAFDRYRKGQLSRDHGPTYPQDINDLRRMLTRIPQAPPRNVRYSEPPREPTPDWLIDTLEEPYMNDKDYGFTTDNIHLDGDGYEAALPTNDPRVRAMLERLLTGGQEGLDLPWKYKADLNARPDTRLDALRRLRAMAVRRNDPDARRLIDWLNEDFLN